MKRSPPMVRRAMFPALAVIRPRALAAQLDEESDSQKDQMS